MKEYVIAAGLHGTVIRKEIKTDYERNYLIKKATENLVWASDIDSIKNIKYISIKKFLRESNILEYYVLKEIDIISRFNHPNITKYYFYDYDFSNETNTFQIFMEYYPYEISNIKYDNTCTEMIKMEMFMKIFFVISLFHFNGVIHGDIKTSNILYDHNYEPHVIDFGNLVYISKNIRKPTDIIINQKQKYIPKNENNQNIHKIHTTVIDTYALGVIFYEIFTENKIYDGQTLSYNEIYNTLFNKKIKGVKYISQILYLLLDTTKLYYTKSYDTIYIEFIKYFIEFKGKEYISEILSRYMPYMYNIFFFYINKQIKELLGITFQNYYEDKQLSFLHMKTPSSKILEIPFVNTSQTDLLTYIKYNIIDKTNFSIKYTKFLIEKLNININNNISIIDYYKNNQESFLLLKNEFNDYYIKYQQNKILKKGVFEINYSRIFHRKIYNYFLNLIFKQHINSKDSSSVSFFNSIWLFTRLWYSVIQKEIIWYPILYTIIKDQEIERNQRILQEFFIKCIFKIPDINTFLTSVISGDDSFFTNDYDFHFMCLQLIVSLTDISKKIYSLVSSKNEENFIVPLQRIIIDYNNGCISENILYKLFNNNMDIIKYIFISSSKEPLNGTYNLGKEIENNNTTEKFIKINYNEWNIINSPENYIIDFIKKNTYKTINFIPISGHLFYDNRLITGINMNIKNISVLLERINNNQIIKLF